MAESIDKALSQVRLGCPVILMDEEKEAEGDLFCAAAVATPEVLQFMIRRGSGLLCMSQPRTRLEEIGIPRISEGIDFLVNGGFPRVNPGGISVVPPHWQKFLTSLNGRVAGTPFHFPVDLATHDSGISVLERLETIQALMDPEADIDWFTTPGHQFTLGSHPEGMAGRWGHTEASVDLCRALELPPAGLLCEIIGDDGTMLRGDEMQAFAAEYHVEMLSIRHIPGLLNRQAVAVPG